MPVRIALLLLLAATSAQPEAVIAPSGAHHALVIFAGFSGLQDERLPPWAVDLFEADSPGSLTHFFDTMSDGRFKLSGAIAPRRYLSARPPTAFVAQSANGSGRFGEFVTEILAQVDAEVDFAEFDADGDGTVDLLYVVVPQLPTGFISGGATGVARLGFADAYVTTDRGADGVSIRISPRLGTLQTGRTFAEAVGTIAHETGHLLGLPDLFNTTFVQRIGADPAEDSAGIGAWGLMGWGAAGWHGDDGPNPFSAWSLLQLGWVQPVELDRVEQLLRLAPVGTSGQVARITLGPRESFLLAYRSRVSSHYERNLPGEGLLVWHVSGEVDQQLQLDLVCADGLWREAGFPLGTTADPDGGDNLDFWAHDDGYRLDHGGNLGDATDPFDGVRSATFSATTNPAATRLDGRSGVEVRNIQMRAGVMTADVSLPPADLEVRDLSIADADHDGELTPGEDGIVRIRLANNGGVPARDVRVEVTTTDTAVTILQGMARFGDIAVGGSAATPLDSTGLPRFVIHSQASSSEVMLNVRVHTSDTVQDITIERAITVATRARVWFRGIVTDEAGVPVVEQSFSCGTGCDFDTDAAGRFATQVYPATRAVFSTGPVDHLGLAPYHGYVRIDGDTEAHIVMQWLLDGHGYVYLAGAEPAVGARVETEVAFSGLPYARATTDSTGRFSLSLPARTVALKVTPSPAQKTLGYLTQLAFVRIERDSPAVLQLEQGSQVAITMQDAAGSPLTGGGRIFDWSRQSWQFDASGLAQIFLPARPVSVHYQAPGARLPGWLTAILDVGRTASTLVRWPRYHTVRGVVHSAVALPARTQVSLLSHDGRFEASGLLNRDNGFEVRAPTGTFDILLVPEADMQLPLQHLGRVDVSGATSLQVDVPALERLRLWLLNADGQAAGGYAVTATPVDGPTRPRARVAEDGLALLHGVPGAYRLSVTHPQGRVSQQLPDTVVLGGTRVPEVVLPRRSLREVSVSSGGVPTNWLASLLVELSTDPRRPTYHLDGAHTAPGEALTAVRVAPDEDFPLDAAGATHAVGMLPGFAGRYIGVAQQLGPAGEPVHMDLGNPGGSYRLFGQLSGAPDDLRHTLVLRLYDERRGTVVQWSDSYGVQPGEASFAVDGRQYLLEAPAGNYTVRVGVFSVTGGFVAEYDLGTVEVTADRRWDIDLADVPTAVTGPVAAIPDQAALYAAYPNPFNHSVVIEFDTAVEGRTELAVYNLLGQRVRNLVAEPLAPGQHRVLWHGDSDDGQQLATGVYVSVLRVGSFRAARKLLLLR